MAKTQELNEVVEAGKQVFEKTIAKQAEQTEKFTQNARKGFEDLGKIQNEALNAVIESQMIFAKGLEEVSKNFVQYAQKSFMANAEAWKAVTEIKTPADLVNFNKSYSQEKVETLVKESVALGENLVKVANDSNKPLQQFWKNSSDKFVKTIVA